MKHIISTHYSNDDDRLYRFARKAIPPFYPERGLGPDGIVAICCVLLAIATGIFVWATERML